MTINESEKPKMLLQDEPSGFGCVGYLAKTINGTDQKGIFGFASAQFIETSWNDNGRCDGGFIGPMSFHVPDGNGGCSCGRLDQNPADFKICDNGFGRQDALEISQAVMTALPAGYISYLEFKDRDSEEILLDMHWNSAARTLQELFKLMFEWRDAYLLLGVESLPAVTADLLLTELDMPVDLELWIRTQLPDQSVVKYLNGDTAARQRVTPPNITDDFSYWLHNKIAYSSRNYGLTA